VLGGVLIAVAVVIGFVLLFKGFDQEGGVVGTGSAGETTTTTTAPGPGVDETTTTTLATNPPAQVAVLVANGTGVSGVAGENQATLEGAGYTQVETANAPVQQESAVFFVEGSQGDAQAVATVLEIADSQVVGMPDPPPVTLAGATVLVIIGADKV
jgi:hypothetical protein